MFTGGRARVREDAPLSLMLDLMIHGESNPFGMQSLRLQAGCGRAGEPLFLRRSPAGALRSRYHTAPLAAAGSSQRAFQHWRYAPVLPPRTPRS